MKKPTIKVSKRNLRYGRSYGVTLKEAKRAFLSGMSKPFKKKVKVKWTV